MSYKEAIRPFGDEINTGSPGSILSGLYRAILKELGIEEARFRMFVDRYVESTSNGCDSKELSSMKGNARNELLKSVMTWKVFLKGLSVLNITQFEIAVQLYMDDDKDNVALVKRVTLSRNKIEAEKQIENSGTILSGIFKEAMFQMDIDIDKFNEYVHAFIQRAGVPQNLKEISSARGNLKKELLKPAMTWNLFIKGMVFLKVKKFDIGISLHHFNGKITQHYRSIVLDYVNPEDMEGATSSKNSD